MKLFETCLKLFLKCIETCLECCLELVEQFLKQFSHIGCQNIVFQHVSHVGSKTVVLKLLSHVGCQVCCSKRVYLLNAIVVLFPCFVGGGNLFHILDVKFLVVETCSDIGCIECPCSSRRRNPNAHSRFVCVCFCVCFCVSTPWNSMRTLQIC